MHGFFTSISRHTMYWRDWSSDVCSCDLATPGRRGGGRPEQPLLLTPSLARPSGSWLTAVGEPGPLTIRCPGLRGAPYLQRPRSEERRVGKERRPRWSPYH